jgi:hypothetical protein
MLLQCSHIQPASSAQLRPRFTRENHSPSMKEEKPKVWNYICSRSRLTSFMAFSQLPAYICTSEGWLKGCTGNQTKWSCIVEAWLGLMHPSKHTQRCKEMRETWPQTNKPFMPAARERQRAALFVVPRVNEDGLSRPPRCSFYTEAYTRDIASSVGTEILQSTKA